MDFILKQTSLGENGRCGNQLWQVACMLGIQAKHKCTVIIPKWKYANDFNLVVEQSDDQSFTHFYEEPYFHYKEFNPDEAVEFRAGEQKIINLKGYFQSIKYWQHCEEEVLKQFDFSDGLLKKAKRMILRAKQFSYGSVLISIHFRFGDYVGNPYYANLTGTDYYIEAIEYFKKSFPNKKLVFFIFSDDKELAWNFVSKKLIGVMDKGKFIISNFSEEIDDLCLQSLCTHNIIANSSFSWWSSFLNKNKDKTVIAPTKDKWFGTTGKHNNVDNLYLPEWILI